MPEYYTWNKQNKKWVKRKRGVIVDNESAIFKTSAIGRIYSVSPRQGDCYYVRLLLTEIRGPTSFASLRTVEGQEMSYREACLARGLLEDDNHLFLAMEEASVIQSFCNSTF